MKLCYTITNFAKINNFTTTLFLSILETYFTSQPHPPYIT